MVMRSVRQTITENATVVDQHGRVDDAATERVVSADHFAFWAMNVRDDEQDARGCRPRESAESCASSCVAASET